MVVAVERAKEGDRGQAIEGAMGTGGSIQSTIHLEGARSVLALMHGRTRRGQK